jgi:hypothetical protein
MPVGICVSLVAAISLSLSWIMSAAPQVTSLSSSSRLLDMDLVANNMVATADSIEEEALDAGSYTPLSCKFSKQQLRKRQKYNLDTIIDPNKGQLYATQINVTKSSKFWISLHNEKTDPVVSLYIDVYIIRVGAKFVVAVGSFSLDFTNASSSFLFLISVGESWKKVRLL